MTATYLHLTQTVAVPAAVALTAAPSGLITLGPAASAWWLIKAVKISVDFSANMEPNSHITPGVIQAGGHVVTSLFFGAPSATNIQSRVDNTILLNDTSAILSSVVVYPGQYVTAQYVNSANSPCVCTLEIFGIQYDTPPPIDSLPSIAGTGFRGGLITGAGLAPTEVNSIQFNNPGLGNKAILISGMRNPITFYSLSMLWLGSGEGVAIAQGNWYLQDHSTGAIFAHLNSDMQLNTGNTGLAMPPARIDFGGVTINEFAHDTANATSGFVDLIYFQDQGNATANTEFCLATITYSQGLNIPLY